MLNLIIDLETLDNLPTAAVTNFTAIVFNPSDMIHFDELVKNAFDVKLNWKEQLQEGRTTSVSTIEFWKKEENKTAFDLMVKPKGSDVKIQDLFPMFYKYLEQSGYDLGSGNDAHAWSRGNSFDFSILENLYQHYNEANPIAYWNQRDIRTAIDTIGCHIDPEHKNRGYLNHMIDLPNMIKHDSKCDCARDIMQMQYAHYQLIQKLGY